MTLARTLSILLCTAFTMAKADERAAIDDWLHAIAASPRLAAVAIASPPVVESEGATGALVSALESSKDPVRQYAARALGEAPGLQPQSIEKLAQLLRDRDERVRNEATVALAKRGHDAVPALIAALTWNDAGFENRERGMGDNETWPADGFPRSDLRPSDYASVALILMGTEAASDVVAAATRAPDLRPHCSAILRGIGPAAASAILPSTESTDPALRTWAIRTLSEIGPADRASCGALTKAATGSAEKNTRWAAINALDRCGGFGEWLPRLAHDPDSAIRGAAWQRVQFALYGSQLSRALQLEAARAFLSTIAHWEGNPDDELVLVVINLQDRDVSVFTNELRDETVAALRAILRSPNAHWRYNGALLVPRLGNFAGSLLPELMPLLDDDATVRGAVIEALAAAGPAARAAAPALLSRYERGGRKDDALLGAIASTARAETSLPLVIDALRRPRMREAGARALAQLGVSGISVLEELAPVVRTPAAADAKRELVESLAAAGESGVAALAELIEHGDADTRRLALRTLEGRGIRSARSDRAVRIALSDGDPTVRAAAVGLSPALDDGIAAAAMLKDPDENVQKAAVAALRRAGPCAPAAVPLLRQRIIATRGERRVTAAVTLLNVLPDYDDTLPIIREAFADPAADDAVRLLQEHADRVAPALLKLISDERPIVVLNVLSVLHFAHHLTSDAVPALVRLLQSETAAIRLGALVVLRELGPAGAGAREAIVRTLDDELPELRSAAADTLFHVDRRPEEVPSYVVTTTDDYVARVVSERTLPVIDTARPPRWVLTAGSVESLPPLPRMPQASAYDLLRPDALLASANQTLRDAYDRLSGALRSLGYDEQGLFSVPQGFALATRVERIHADGKAYTLPDRWTRDRIPPGSLREYLSALFLDRPGTFRLFVFVITPATRVDMAAGRMDEEQAWRFTMSGGRVLPADVGKQPYAGHHCHILIYTFEKKPGQVAHVIAPDPLGFGRHVTASGIMTLLNH